MTITRPEMLDKVGAIMKMLSLEREEHAKAESTNEAGFFTVKWPVHETIPVSQATLNRLGSASKKVTKKAAPARKALKVTEPGGSDDPHSPARVLPASKGNGKVNRTMQLFDDAKLLVESASKKGGASARNGGGGDGGGDGDDADDDEANLAEEAEIDQIRKKYTKLIEAEDDEDDKDDLRAMMEKKVKRKRAEFVEEKKVRQAERKASRSSKHADEDSNDGSVDEAKFDTSTKQGLKEFAKAKAKSMVSGGARAFDSDAEDEDEDELAELERSEEEKTDQIIAKPMDSDEEDEATQATKIAERKRQRDEDRDTYERAKAMKVALQASSRLDGYEEDEETSDESETNAKRKRDESMAVEDTGTSGAFGKSSSAGSVKQQKMQAALRAAKKDKKLPKIAKLVKHPAAAIAAEAKVKPETPGEDEDKREERIDALRPAMIHRRVLPHKVLQQAEDMKNATRDVLFSESRLLPSVDGKTVEKEGKVLGEGDEYRQKADAIFESILSQAMMYMIAVTDPKLFAALMHTAIPAMEQFSGNYDDDQLWAQRKKRMLFDGDGARPVDMAFTLHKMNEAAEYLPEDYVREVAGSIILSWYKNEAFKTRVTKMVATQRDVDAVNKQVASKNKKKTVKVDDGESEDESELGGGGGDDNEWKCALSGEPIERGTPLLCIASAPCPIADLKKRDQWLRRCVLAGALPGITKMAEFTESSYAKAEMMESPLCAFVIDVEALEEEMEKLGITSVEAEKKPAPEAKSEEDASSGEKRKATSSGGHEAAMGEDSGKPASKRARPSFDVMPIPYPPPPTYDFTRASMQDEQITYKMQPTAKDRRFTASSQADAERVGPGYQYFFTDHAVEVVKKAKSYLYEVQQFGLPEGASDAATRKALNLLFAEWEYDDDEMSTTAAVLVAKLEQMKTPDYSNGVRKKPDLSKFGELLRLAMCMVVHPCENSLLKSTEITGRARPQLTSECDTSMQVGEIPFGRMPTTNEFLSQFLRITVDALYHEVVLPLAKGEIDEIDLSGGRIFNAVLSHAKMESGEEKEQKQARLLSTAKEFAGHLSKDRQALRKSVAAAWLKVRAALLQSKLSDDVGKLAESKLFINRLFPLYC